MARKSPLFAEEVKKAIGDRSIRNAARLTDTSHTSLLNWLYGDIPIDPDYIRAFADGVKYPRSKLLDAAGYKVTTEDIENDRSLAQANKKAPPTLSRSLERMGTLLDTSAVEVLSTIPCGRMGDREAVSGVYLPERLEYDYTLEVEGGSMDPVFREGTILFIKEIPDNTPNLEYPNIIYLEDRHEPTCAYVEPGDEWETYILYKENGAYEEETIRASDCLFQGVVVHYVAQPKKKRRKQA